MYRLMLVLDRERDEGDQKEFEELESQIIKLIDRIRVGLDLQGHSFQKFEKDTLYPFLKLLIKKFLSYCILKKLEEIANQCEMVITAQKISSSLNLLEKKLFKNNKLHEKKKNFLDDDVDIEEEMKKKFGFDVSAHKKQPVQVMRQKMSLFKKKNVNNCIPVVKKTEKKKVLPKNENYGGNRSSLFYNKFIRKRPPSQTNTANKQKRGEVQKNFNSRYLPSQRKTHIYGKMNGNASEKDIPDFFKLNKMISQKNKNVIELQENKLDSKKEKLRKEQLKNWKLPNLKKKKSYPRRLKTSFKYTKLVRGKKSVEDQNNENIINLRSRADILNKFEQEMMQDLTKVQGSLKESFSFENLDKFEPNKIIGVPSKKSADLFNNLEDAKTEGPLSKFTSKPYTCDTGDKQKGENNLGGKSGSNQEFSDRLHTGKENEGNALEGTDKTRTKENNAVLLDNFEGAMGKSDLNDNDVVFEIGSNDWENDIFGKHTPTKDFL
jgi:hypothetical protein